MRLAAIVRAVLLGVLLGGAGWLVTIELGRNETEAQLRGIAYRLCQRAANDRAFAHMAVPRTQRLYVEQRLPILDCRPNLRGRPARPMTSAAQRRFVARFQRGDLSARERGLCEATLNRDPRAC